MDVNERIQENMGLVYFTMRKFGLKPTDDEALSLAMEALWKAIKTFDESKGFKFATYASVCLYNACGMYYRKLKRESRYPIQSLDEELYDKITLADTIPDNRTPELVYLEDEHIEYINKILDKIIADTKSPKVKLLLEAWRASDYTANQQDLARIAGRTQSYVSRVLSATRHKIRKELEDEER